MSVVTNFFCPLKILLQCRSSKKSKSKGRLAVADSAAAAIAAADDNDDNADDMLAFLESKKAAQIQTGLESAELATAAATTTTTTTTASTTTASTTMAMTDATNSVAATTSAGWHKNCECFGRDF